MQTLWIGRAAPPASVAAACGGRDWALLTADPEAAAAAVPDRRPDAVLVGVTDTDFDALRAAAPETPIAYCPPETTPDGVAAATAAGVDVVLPQDADEWDAGSLLDRIAGARTAIAQRTNETVSDGAGANQPRQSAGQPPSATETDALPEGRPPPSGTLAVDETGRISYVGERAAGLLDRNTDALLGSDLRDALPWEGLDRLAQVTNDLDAEDGTVSTVERLMPANRWLRLTARPTDEGATITIEQLDDAARRRVVLDRIHGVTRRLFAAETPQAVAEIACEATRNVLGFDLVAVRLYDPVDDVLRLAAKTEGVEKLMPARPTYEAGEGVAGQVFEMGDPKISPDLEEDRFGAVRSAITLPLEDHGTISIGSIVPDAFDEEELSLARLLSTTVVAALDRADREARLRRREAVLESIQGMVFALDENRIVDYVSTPLAERMGTTREALVGRHVTEFVDVEAFYRAESQIASGESEVSLSLQIAPVDGESFPAHVDLSVLEQTESGESLVGVVEDRSTLAAAREDLRQEHERLWTLFENLPDPVVDAEHVENGPVIRAANDAFAEVFNCDREAIVGERIDEVLSSPAGAPAGSMPPEAINEQISEGAVTGAKVQRETEQGARTFLFRGIPYAQDDSVRAFGIYTDVTDIERRERHVKVLDRLLRHNLRNDLGVVIGRAENVLEHTEDPEIREEAVGLVEAANGLIDLSDTAKRIRRIIEEPTADRSPIPVAPLFEGVATDARGRFPRATVDVADGEDLAVLATSDVRLALEELVENAIVHGGDPVELRAEPFESAPSAWVDLLVMDAGPGIPETERAAVTGDRDITQLQHGSGLGLWLVRWAVESVGGDLGFERRDGRTVARIRLRRVDAE
ncbi:PAS domain-containing protein [Halolamina salifodinae]|uniref:histidine kinase n=1 Tax=Halolamina salifodinae TaxID=1202767 RepID=A0A8T4H2R5_9EURY|nr:PAS domain-containing protein [Halolamina salifodinae]MBP1988114.1 PAS domain S-box-containing protein [Halolamina salifodinae]